LQSCNGEVQEQKMPFDEIEGDDSYRRFADFSGTPFREVSPGS